MIKRILPVLAGIVLLSACSTQKVAHTAKDQVKSVTTYHAVASWYGVPFHGRTAANGERYNMYAFTAAHKTLPFGTTVKLTNEVNHQSVIVRVTDRGPYIKGRDFDLSYKAAKMLGIDRTGTGFLKVQILPQKLPERLLALQDRAPLEQKDIDLFNRENTLPKPALMLAQTEPSTKTSKIRQNSTAASNLIALAQPKSAVDAQLIDVTTLKSKHTPRHVRRETSRVAFKTGRSKQTFARLESAPVTGDSAADDFVPFSKIVALEKPRFSTTVAQSPGNYFLRATVASLRTANVSPSKTTSFKGLFADRLFAITDSSTPEAALTHFFSESHPDFLLDVVPVGSVAVESSNHYVGRKSHRSQNPGNSPEWPVYRHGGT